MGELLPVRVERVKDKCKDRSGKEMGYSLRFFLIIPVILHENVQPTTIADCRLEVCDYNRREHLGSYFDVVRDNEDSGRSNADVGTDACL